MPKCLDQCCFRFSLKNGSILIGSYLFVRSGVALSVLLHILVQGSGHVTDRSLLWIAILFGVLIGPRLIYVVVQKIPRPIKNTAVWLVIYGAFDLFVMLIWRPKSWNAPTLLWTFTLCLELVLFFYFALVLWSYSVSVTRRKPTKRERMRMEVLEPVAGQSSSLNKV